jgi:BlaR1 peptidase M56
MIALMAYGMLVALCAAVSALALEPLVRARGWGTRWIWCAALGVSVLGSAAAMFVPVNRPSDAGRLTALQRRSLLAIPTGMDSRMVSPAWGRRLDDGLAVSWAAASAVMLGVLLAGMRRINRERRRAQPLTGSGASVLVTEDLGPAVAGFVRPAVLVPRWVFSLDAIPRRLLLTHEIEHLRAGDGRLLLAGAVATAILPWNPAVWLIARRLRLAVEVDCDVRVLARMPDVRAYGDLLLLTAARRAPDRTVVLATVPGASTDLSRRIDAMIDRRPLSKRWPFVRFAVALGAVVVACESPRPAPVAPVDFARTLAGSANSENLPKGYREIPVLKASDSAFVDYLRRLHPELLSTTSSSPVVRVFTYAGQLIKVERVGLQGDFMKTLSPDSIQSIEVVKGRALPAGLGGGLITITLKDPGEALPARPTAESLCQNGFRRRIGDVPERCGSPTVELRETGKVPRLLQKGDTSLPR